MENQQRIFLLRQLVEEDQELPGGGRVTRRQFIKKGEPLVPGSRFFASGLSTLASASAIAWHQHIDEEEVFVIISGQGFYIDNQGKDHPVTAGDVCFCLKGEKHGLRNPGPQPLTYLGLIVQ